MVCYVFTGSYRLAAVIQFSATSPYLISVTAGYMLFLPAEIYRLACDLVLALSPDLGSAILCGQKLRLS